MNIFSVLDTSDGEEEVVQKGNNKKKEGTQEADKKQPAKNATKPQQNKPRDVKAEEPKASAAKTSAAPTEEVKEKKDDNRGGRARGKEGVRRGDKHHGTDENDKARRPKREFERRSGTGRGREVSRGGRGPYGFGNVEQEAHDAEKDPSKAEAQPENVDETAEPEPESTEVAPEVEEPPSISFDDFLKKREEARLNSSVLSAARAPRQVNLETQFAGLTAKEDELEGSDAKGSKAANQKKDQRSTNKTQLLDVSFKFEVANNDRPRGDRPFGGRGERRDRDGASGRGGRGGRGAPRRPRDAPAPLNSGDFPSL